MSAEAVMTPSATGASCRACDGVETPNPTATGTGLISRTLRRNDLTPRGSDVRAPVTPASETAYRKPCERLATYGRRSSVVVGATR